MLSVVPPFTEDEEGVTSSVRRKGLLETNSLTGGEHEISR
jgi:hypothetical protein